MAFVKIQFRAKGGNHELSTELASGESAMAKVCEVFGLEARNVSITHVGTP
jgi:hypothetical protein